MCAFDLVFSNGTRTMQNSTGQTGSLMPECVRRYPATIALLAFSFLTCLPAGAIDIREAFRESANAPCEPTQFSQTIYKLCSHSACGQILAGERVFRADTGKKSSHCGFKPVNWDLQRCKSIDAKAARATSNIKDTDYVELLRRRCAWRVDCFVPLSKSATCRNSHCGVETPATPIAWESCKDFAFGIDIERLGELQANAELHERIAIQLFLVLDDKRASVDKLAVEAVLDWLRSSPEDARTTAVLSELLTLAVSGRSFTAEAVTQALEN